MPSCDYIAEIYNSYVDDMYTYAIYLGFREYDIIDAIQDVFVQLCERNKNINKISNIKFYLFKSLRNRLIDIYKKENFIISFNNSNQFDTSFSDTQNTPENSLIKGEESDEIEKKIEEMLSLLSPRQREIIYLHFIQEQDYKQVAEIMDINYDNCRKLVYKALLTLRNKYEGIIFIIYFTYLIYELSTAPFPFPSHLLQ
ncbi:MAG: sigma-70 family RNA polymerase sigma factor [Proteiniphilum sp.]|nr:sigma-70 family RNA polymerase sigma factor [Proteiniphilum sp.]MDD3908471.1 sigma-70 family RNA polymerase sigma factor [Proteiniphilum sp.]MDD4415960.1 sigma-70 family RNA polymerase sigma factor [Proteiniphilum sp.]